MELSSDHILPVNNFPKVNPQPSIQVDSKQKPKTEQQNEYIRYLQSQRWRTLSRAVRIRAKGKCEMCGHADGEECAHLTYERIFHERINDLLWLCKKCHRKLDNPGWWE